MQVNVSIDIDEAYDNLLGEQKRNFLRSHIVELGFEELMEAAQDADRLPDVKVIIKSDHNRTLKNGPVYVADSENKKEADQGVEGEGEYAPGKVTERNFTRPYKKMGTVEPRYTDKYNIVGGEIKDTALGFIYGAIKKYGGDLQYVDDLKIYIKMMADRIGDETIN